MQYIQKEVTRERAVALNLYVMCNFERADDESGTGCSWDCFELEHLNSVLVMKYSNVC